MDECCAHELNVRPVPVNDPVLDVSFMSERMHTTHPSAELTEEGTLKDRPRFSNRIGEQIVRIEVTLLTVGVLMRVRIYEG